MGGVDVGVHGDCVGCEDDSCGGQATEPAEFCEEGLPHLSPLTLRLYTDPVIGGTPQ